YDIFGKELECLVYAEQIREYDPDNTTAVLKITVERVLPEAK
ncbi:8473_t:CDS:2, partial [Gigaspora rosea]